MEHGIAEPVGGGFGGVKWIDLESHASYIL